MDEITPDDNNAATWRRPIPTIGDDSSAQQRSQRPDAWAFNDDEIDALRRIIAARRDIRRYRNDAVSDELIQAVIESGHQGPSVGHSQPWRFIVVTDAFTREKAAVMADEQRLRQADLLTPQRKAQLLDLQLEGIREAPVGIIVACDRRTPSSGVLGRNTFTDADMWSCACAIENMWLTARSYGLGMGWVTLFEPEELADLLHLPSGVETLGWLCLGWPDERPPSPGLERRGWSSRLNLDGLVFSERWPENSPAPVINGQAYADMKSSWLDSLSISAPQQKDVVSAHDRADVLLTPGGSLGKFDQALDKVAAIGSPTQATLVVVAADHPVTAHKISAFDPTVTRDVAQACVQGLSMGAATAKAMGIEVITIDAGVSGPPIDGAVQMRSCHDRERGDLATSDAMTADDVAELIASGRELAARIGSSRALCLGEIGIGNTTVASALVSALINMDPADAVGLGASSDTAMMERKRDVLTRSLSRVADRDLSDPITVLSCLGGPEFAVLTGLCLGAAEAKMPIIIDGLATSIAALIAVRISPAVQAYLVASHVSREFAHHAVLAKLGLEPLLEWRMRAGEGIGACYGAQALLTGLKVRQQAAKTDDERQP